MADGGGLKAEVGITLDKLTRQLAAAEARMVRTARKMEGDFTRANRGVARSFQQVQTATGGLTGSGGLRMLSMQLSQVAQQGAATGQWARAFSIQAADIALVFGPLGIAIGAVVAALGPYIASMLSAEDATKKLVDSLIGGQVSLDSVRGSISQLRSLQEAYTSAIAASAGASSSTAATVAANSKREFEARKAVLSIEHELLRVRGMERQDQLKNLQEAEARQVQSVWDPFKSNIDNARALAGRSAGDNRAQLEKLGRIEYQRSRDPASLMRPDLQGQFRTQALAIRKLRAEIELTELAAEEAAAALETEFLDVGGGSSGVGASASGGSGGGRGGGGGRTSGASKAVAEVNEQLETAISLAEEAQRGLSDAFVNIVTGAQSAREAVAQLAAQWAKMLAQRGIDALLDNVFGGLLGNARGNAFSGGRVVPFARGGVVSKPTMFPMAKGMGLMGEAGPEAILPLRRGPGGKLGVEAGGGGVGGRVLVDLSLNTELLDARTVTTSRGVTVGIVRQYDKALPGRLADISRDPKKRT